MLYITTWSHGFWRIHPFAKKSVFIFIIYYRDWTSEQYTPSKIHRAIHCCKSSSGFVAFSSTGSFSVIILYVFCILSLQEYPCTSETCKSRVRTSSHGTTCSTVCAFTSLEDKCSSLLPSDEASQQMQDFLLFTGLYQSILVCEWIEMRN